MSLFARILGSGLGVRIETLETMLGDYQDTLLQNIYRPDFIHAKISVQRELKARRNKKQLDDAALLQKLDALTDSDDPKKR